MGTKWPEKIELPYRQWLANKKPNHPIDHQNFLEFMWQCFIDPANAPSQEEFRERLGCDLECPPDADGWPHPTVDRYNATYGNFPIMAEFIMKKFSLPIPPG